MSTWHEKARGFSEPEGVVEPEGFVAVPTGSGGPRHDVVDALHEAAERSLHRKRDFWAHLRSYLIVNAMIVTVWLVVALLGGTWFFWPVFPLAGWGIGLAFHASAVYGRSARPVTEEEIRSEMERLRRR